VSAQRQPQYEAGNVDWFDADQLDAFVAPEPVNSWLRECGLLTDRLRVLCKDDFRLEVLADAGLASPAGPGHLREVVMCCRDQPCIYARTLIPAATAEAHPWLRSLGNEPLGERLQTRVGVKRSAFRFAALDAAAREVTRLLPEYLVDPAVDILWARTSVFSIGAHDISVTEIFLAGLPGCESAPDSPAAD